MTDTPRFEFEADADDVTAEALVLGFSTPGMAGLSAVDYLVRQHDFESVGHVRTRGLPALAPFEAGTPRHPIQLYDHADADVAVLVCELFVPVAVAEAFTDGLLSWVETTSLSEVAVLNGVPYPHGPTGHDVFATATPAYRERRLAETDIEGLAGGVLDGVVGDLLLRSLSERAPPTGVFITPSHPPGPDLEAAIRLLDAVERVYGIDIDQSELEQSAEKQRQYYAELADRMQSLEEGDGRVGTREYPEDRMFM